jgi:4-amino-4-deoxy-L-arabinose transferase-like glycosyltransferase
LQAGIINSYRQWVVHPWTFPLLIVATAILVHIPNLLGYPAWFYDEGAYLTSSLQWLQTGHLTYYGHPFAPLAILAALFATVNPRDYLIPRMLMVALSVIDGLLLYRVTGLFFPKDKRLAILTPLLYEATPLSARYLRLTVVDNFLVLFLLLSILFILSRPRSPIMSGIGYGAALISKQTAIFFLPGFLVLFFTQKKDPRYILSWLVVSSILPIIWILYGTTQVGFSNLITQQFELTGLGGERAVSAVSLIVQRISTRDPFIFFGLAGIIWAAYKRRWTILAFPVAYYLAFIVLFLKISTVYLIPTLPFLSILAGLMLFEVLDRVPKIGKSKAIKTTLFVILIVALIASSLILVTTQSPSDSQKAALSYVGGLGAPKVITSATYIWMLKQNYPNVTVLDRYTVPWSSLNGSTVYLIVDLPGDFTTINSIPQYQTAFNNSTIVASYNYYNYLVQVRSTTIP